MNLIPFSLGLPDQAIPRPEPQPPPLFCLRTIECMDTFLLARFFAEQEDRMNLAEDDDTDYRHLTLELERYLTCIHAFNSR